jgi:hypothetical protein
MASLAEIKRIKDEEKRQVRIARLKEHIKEADRLVEVWEKKRLNRWYTSASWREIKAANCYSASLHRLSELKAKLERLEKEN